MPTQKSIIHSLEMAHERDPRKAPYGLFSSDDYPAGIGMFMWFSDATQLLDALTEQVPAIHQDPEDTSAEFSTTVSMLREVRRDADPSEVLTERLRAQYQEHLGGCTRIDWWGTIDDFRSPQSEWLKDIVETYLQDYEGTTPDTFDPRSEEFCNYLASYGY